MIPTGVHLFYTPFHHWQDVHAAVRRLWRAVCYNCHAASACRPALIIAPCIAITLAQDPIGE